ncbi:hypothetical protein HPB50_018366 [Hyalomma asiaticum]|uniref:Uncharacterized protein n=1 Tax=Hyalomma asiaticum TaxID=266040 RepID=A0ACB7TJR2_HYAAI|nr:hypothetical protein HPB50_018366 [Hyalomma asiaticum]
MLVDGLADTCSASTMSSDNSNSSSNGNSTAALPVVSSGDEGLKEVASASGKCSTLRRRSVMDRAPRYGRAASAQQGEVPPPPTRCLWLLRAPAWASLAQPTMAPLAPSSVPDFLGGERGKPDAVEDPGGGLNSKARLVCPFPYVNRRNGCDEVLKVDVLSGAYESYRIRHSSSRFEEGGCSRLTLAGVVLRVTWERGNDETFSKL